MYLGIDCGTQGTKALILDAESGQVLGEGYSPHPLISKTNGCREQEPQWWIKALVSAYKQAVSQAAINAKHIRGISVSGQQHGLVALDKNGAVIRPCKLWCDTETAPQNATLLKQIGGEPGSMAKLGLVLATGYTLSKLSWLKENEPANFARIAHILLPHDYINFWLTGNMVAEYGDASGTGYFDIRRRCWAPELLDAISADHRLTQALPSLIQAHETAGKVRGEIARQLGLSENVIVGSGGGDNMMGAIGTGNISDGIVTLSLGTSGALYTHTSTTPELIPTIANFCSSSNGWLPLICTMNLTGALNQVRDLFGFDLAALHQAIKETPIGADGLSILPFFNGERTPPLPEATGSLFGINMQNLTPGHLCRATMEGVSFGLRYGLDQLQSTGITSKQIRLIGGGAKSLLWRQMIADIMNIEVVCPSIGEGAALGAAIQAAWCTDHHFGIKTSLTRLCEQSVSIDQDSIVSPNPDSVLTYQKAYKVYIGNLKHQWDTFD